MRDYARLPHKARSRTKQAASERMLALRMWVCFTYTRQRYVVVNKGNAWGDSHNRPQISRIRFALRSYVRTRLKKIEKYVLHITQRPVLLQRLSASERDYAIKWVKRERWRECLCVCVCVCSCYSLVCLLSIDTKSYFIDTCEQRFWNEFPQNCSLWMTKLRIWVWSWNSRSMSYRSYSFV